jgi:uncharacterized protein (DUF2141 family)
MLVGAAPGATLHVSIENLRNHSGLLQLCLMRNAKTFPDCVSDPTARRMTVSAASAAPVLFSDLPSGAYALSVIHDENSNARLDTFAGIPREGFGFSRNPTIHFGPPSFADASFVMGAGDAQQSVRMRYLL